jgi:hypothetical protein
MEVSSTREQNENKESKKQGSVIDAKSSSCHHAS